MITGLKLQQFKGFREANLGLGRLTVLVGANASGKSNLRDALRFLHGIARDYTLAETIGEKWIEGGVLQWRGIRGGTREAAYCGARTFVISARFGTDLATLLEDEQDHLHVSPDKYEIEVSVAGGNRPPEVIAERLTLSKHCLFDTRVETARTKQGDPAHIYAEVHQRKKGRNPVRQFLNSKPILTQLSGHTKVSREVRDKAQEVIDALASIRFLDLSPDAMRIPSLPGQTILGDRGENLSSVLYAICQDADREAELTSWLRELTPMDVCGFEFPADQTGKILVALKERDGVSISAHSASDGTLRFLAVLAALLGPKPARFYFFEELENGIHPSRLHLLLQLIETKVREGRIQIMATSHSPQLLSLLSEDSLKAAALTYRLPEEREAQIRGILDIPDVKRIIEQQDLATLQASGWFEDTLSFLEGDTTER